MLGGNNIEGAFNIVGWAVEDATLLPSTDPRPFVDPDTELSEGGYVINQGTSLLMAIAYEEEGVQARSVLTFGNSSDPASPYYDDQTAELFSMQTYRMHCTPTNRSRRIRSTSSSQSAASALRPALESTSGERAGTSS